LQSVRSRVLGAARRERDRML